MKNGETCDKDGNISANDVSITDKDDSGSTDAQRAEKVHVLIFCVPDTASPSDMASLN
jgi:hypothetical protein